MGFPWGSPDHSFQGVPPKTDSALNESELGGILHINFLLARIVRCLPFTMAIAVLHQRAGSPLTFRGTEWKRGMQARCMLGTHSQQLVRWYLSASRRCVSMKAARNGQSGPSSSSDFNLAEYIEAKVENGTFVGLTLSLLSLFWSADRSTAQR